MTPDVGAQRDRGARFLGCRGGEHEQAGRGTPENATYREENSVPVVGSNGSGIRGDSRFKNAY